MKDIITDIFAAPGAEVSIIPVMQGEGVAKLDESQLPDSLPILALRNAVLFPGTVFPITIGREKSIRLIEDAERNNTFIGAVPQNDLAVEDPREQDLYPYGTVAKIIKTLEMPDGTITAILQGYKRFELQSIVEYEPYMLGRVRYQDDFVPEIDNQMKMIAESLKEKAATVIRSSAMVPREAVSALKGIDNFEFLVNFIATTVEVENYMDKVELLQYSDLRARAMGLLSVLDTQVEFHKIKQEIQQKVKTEIDQQQREYYLNNQLKTIQEELGMDDVEEFAQLRARAEEKLWPAAVQAIFDKEMMKLERYNPSSPDYSIQYNYIQFMLDLPWGVMSNDNLDLKNAQKVLDDDHYGLDKVKERIIEYLAVLKLKGDMKSPILCLYGPPGVGKTSLGKSIAKALGRKYVRIALGGVHDESEIRGHRKTYVGALPGRILNGINRAGTSNPVIVLDEIDKMIKEYTGNANNFKRGIVFDDTEEFGDKVSITVIATGFKMARIIEITEGNPGNIIVVDSNFVYKKDEHAAEEGIELPEVRSTKIGYNNTAIRKGISFEEGKKPLLLVGERDDKSELENTPAIKRQAVRNKKD